MQNLIKSIIFLTFQTDFIYLYINLAKKQKNKVQKNKFALFYFLFTAIIPVIAPIAMPSKTSHSSVKLNENEFDISEKTV